jgi:hypothetical protein
VLTGCAIRWSCLFCRRIGHERESTDFTWSVLELLPILRSFTWFLLFSAIYLLIGWDAAVLLGSIPPPALPDYYCRKAILCLDSHVTRTHQGITDTSALEMSWRRPQATLFVTIRRDTALVNASNTPPSLSLFCCL